MSQFIDLIAKIRAGGSPANEEIDAAITRVEQWEFYMAEMSRPEFIMDVREPGEENQLEADAEKDRMNAENGYDKAGNIIAPIPDELTSTD